MKWNHRRSVCGEYVSFLCLAIIFLRATFNLRILCLYTSCAVSRARFVVWASKEQCYNFFNLKTHKAGLLK